MPGLNRRAVREYLAALDPTPPPERKTPKVISLSSPCSAWTDKAHKRVQFGYALNRLIDIENVVIVDVEATPTRRPTDQPGLVMPSSFETHNVHLRHTTSAALGTQ